MHALGACFEISANNLIAVHGKDMEVAGTSLEAGL
jgi:hypothetical protein